MGDNPKQKYAIYFSKEQARRFAHVYRRALEKNDRAQWGEVMKELMGFPVPPGKKPLTDDIDKRIISSGSTGDRESHKHGPFRPVDESIHAKARKGGSL